MYGFIVHNPRFREIRFLMDFEFFMYLDMEEDDTHLP